VVIVVVVVVMIPPVFLSSEKVYEDGIPSLLSNLKSPCLNKASYRDVFETSNLSSLLLEFLVKIAIESSTHLS